MKNALDQFYTKDEVALKLCEIIKAKLKDKLEFYTFLEPSAGGGAFIKALNKSFENNEIIALDLEPKAQNIKQCDFFSYYTNAQKIFTIGNPPFGKRADLAIRFFNHASVFSDYIAFIVPLQFEKWSVQKNLNKAFSLIYSQNLEPNSFVFNGKDYALRSCFQIWTRLKTNTDLRLKQAPATTHKDFEMWQYNNTKEARKYFDKSRYAWDFAVVRQGFYDYTHFIIQEKELNPRVQYIFFKANNDRVMMNLKSLDFETLSKKNTIVPGFGKADVVAMYKRMFDE